MKIRYKVLAGLIPLLILLSMTIIPLTTILFGEEVVLKTLPYDPRDLFRGDYVVLRYEVEEVSFGKVTGDTLKQVIEEESQSYPVYKKKVYITLQQGTNGIHTAEGISLEKPKDAVYLQGEIQYIDFNRDRIMLNLNLDKYFVPENTGMALEEASRRGEIKARVKVFNGYAMLIDIL